ncbi:GAP family protein [Agromyces sp. C10]|uniref:GAP family protein n=1 Tax=Agromyces sp. C10 TaxID=2935077 RepID=UPI00200B3624|nr:GAP family protein [Agromyces sp. C10]MCK8610051.1 GAP family protein [Agromyces sp. C10]
MPRRGRRRARSPRRSSAVGRSTSSSRHPTSPSRATPTCTIKILLGLLLLFLALRQWQGRPKPGETAALPKWMEAIGEMTPARAFLLAFALAAINPKNLIMAAGAGVLIGSAGEGVGGSTIAIAVLTVLAASSVAIPVVAYLLASERMSAPLESLRRWLVDHNAAVMAVLLLVIGVVMIGKGIGSF